MENSVSPHRKSHFPVSSFTHPRNGEFHGNKGVHVGRRLGKMEGGPVKKMGGVNPMVSRLRKQPYDIAFLVETCLIVHLIRNIV